MSQEFSGLLRERIVIERPISLRNAMGLQQPGWEQVCRCLASVVLESVGAEAEGQALSAMPRYTVAIRWREGVALDQRIVWRGKTMVIRQQRDDPRRRDRIILRCEEVRT
ncbi:MAG: head-tail adaptor protein [Pseudomonadota bacterium]